ncbi:MAG: hypothetical protein JSW25_08880 [Thermoplasmata archaeon]|nr:MAG: hypothetical protein JSW25_08880 [Thermoplasmata archaeon]
MAVERPTLGKRSAVLLVVAVLSACALPLFPIGSAVQSGGTGLEDADVAGCHCHNLEPDPDVTLNLMGLPDRYQPGDVYDLVISVAGGPPVNELATAAGGFMVSCSNGSFAVPEGSDQVQVFNNGQSASHTQAGNSVRQWRLVWRAPKAGTGDAVFHLSANSVNGDGVETGELDAYNSMRTFSSGEAEAVVEDGGPSEWGMPIAAYWMGTIAFLATLIVTWVAYYIIKGTSRHHVVHIGSRRRYTVEERTAPSSFGATFVIAVLTIVQLASSMLLVWNIWEGASDTALAVNLAVVLGLFVLIIAVYRSAFVPKLTSIEPDETGPGVGG